MKPYAIVVDLDNTLVNSSHREPYDYEKIMDDKVIDPTADIIWGNNDIPRKIIILSGRSEDCREQTETWLSDSGYIYWDKLILNKDKENQVVFKKKAIQKLMRYYTIRYCIDDNPEVVKMFKSLGLKAYSIT